jgi:hypothetical protein
VILTVPASHQTMLDYDVDRSDSLDQCQLVVSVILCWAMVSYCFQQDFCHFEEGGVSFVSKIDSFEGDAFFGGAAFKT